MHLAAVAEGNSLRLYVNGLLDSENTTVGSIITLTLALALALALTLALTLAPSPEPDPEPEP